MYRISLVNMPFAALNLPSIGLTQLKAIVDSKFGTKVSVEICYVNQDLGRYMGVTPYNFIASSMESHNTGLGEWLFRQVAFPELADNLDQYFRRFFPQHNEQNRMYRQTIEQKRGMFGPALDQFIAKYKLAQSDIVGFTSMFTQNVSSIAMAKRLKAANPDVVTVIGGANCEAPMGQELVKNVECVDFVFSGPALKSFPEFIENILNDERERCHTINGVFSKLNCSGPRPQASLGKTFEPPRVIGDELELDEVVELDYDFFLDKLEDNFPNKQIEPNLLFETSRGCWWGEKAHCTFCGLNGMSMNYRAMRPENAVTVIKSLFKHSSRCSRLSSVDNILPKNYLKEVFPFIETPRSMALFYEVKSDLSEEDLQVLAKARVKSIQPGIESLATSTLKLMKKGSSAFQNLQLLKNCVMYDVSPEWNLLVGFPGEEDDVYKKYLKDLPLLMHLPPPSGVYPVRFDRYSPYFVKAKEYELDLAPVDYYELTYPFSQESLYNMAYYFADRNMSARYFTTMVKWIGRIREKFQPWGIRWSDRKAERPMLFYKQKGSSSIVFDSRADSPVEHTIDFAGTQILDLLVKPKKMTDLGSELAHIPHLDLQKEISLLEKQGLIFQEGERFLSLVLPNEPPRRKSAAIGGFAL